MAAQLGRNPYTFDAVGQSYPNKIKVATIRFFCGVDSGVCVLKDREGGVEIYRSSPTNAGGSDTLRVAGSRSNWFNSVFVDQLPANSMVYLYIE